MRNGFICSIVGVVIAAIAIVYWPVIHANFVWDDWLGLHDNPWLTEGDEWKHYIFRDFAYWAFYFRPLYVAFLTLQVRLFDGAPGPMHAVSLGLHLIDTLLVGLLSWRCDKSVSSNIRQRTWLMAASMLLYGMHPVLTEPVAWIGCQCDLIATMFMLLGLLANRGIEGDRARATTVATLFFLAACAKESAISFPLLVVIFDWALLSRGKNETVLSAIWAVVRRNWMTYAGIFLAGIIYLIFRNWALGVVVGPAVANPLSPFARLQEVCSIYLHYWRTIFWPMPGIGPIHPIDMHQFGVPSLSSLLTDMAAIGILVTSLYFAIRRTSPAGCIVLAVTASLFPVLHIFSLNFELSLYHERYTMMALSMICAMLPLLRPHLPVNQAMRRLALPLLSILGFFWLTFAVVDIRFMLPMWSNDVHLWQWALAVNPHTSQSKDNLLDAYVKNRDYADARALGDRVLADPAPCTTCMVTIAKLAIDDKDPTRATIALERIRHSRLHVMDQSTLHEYYLTTGKMLIQQKRLGDAEQVLQIAVALAPLDPQSQLSLATTLAFEGKKDQAQAVGAAGIALLPEDKRGPAMQSLSEAIATGPQPTQQAPKATEDQ